MNKSGDENRSVRNTKKRLQEALLTLLQKKPINQITVKDVTCIQVYLAEYQSNYAHTGEVYGVYE